MTTTHETEPLSMPLAKALEIVEGYLRGQREPAFAEIVRQARDTVAAMPELVAALESFVEWRHHGGGHANFVVYDEAARAALAKAKEATR